MRTAPTAPESVPAPQQKPLRLPLARCGMATGIVALILYGGCVLTTATVSKETATSFFNSLLHGLDIGPVLRDNMPLREVATGLFSTFILGWFVGALFAAVFNFSGEAPEDKR